jgi:hypothetical protein
MSMSCTDGPGLPCNETGCPAPIINCSFLAANNACQLPIEKIWEKSAPISHPMPVWMYCGISCKQCGRFLPDTCGHGCEQIACPHGAFMRKVRYVFEHHSGCCGLFGTCAMLYASNLVIAWHIIRTICGLQNVLRLQYLHEHADGQPLVAGIYNLTLDSRAWGIVEARCTLAGCGRQSQRASPGPSASAYLARFVVDSLSLGPARASAQEGSRLHRINTTAAARLNIQLGPILRYDQDRLPYALWERPNVDIAPQLAKLNRLLELHRMHACDVSEPNVRFDSGLRLQLIDARIFADEDFEPPRYKRTEMDATSSQLLDRLPFAPFHDLAGVASKMNSDVVAGSVRALLAHFVRAGLGTDSPSNYSLFLNGICGAPLHRELPRLHGSLVRGVIDHRSRT